MAEHADGSRRHHGCTAASGQRLRGRPPSAGRTAPTDGQAASQPRHCTHRSMNAGELVVERRRPRAPRASAAMRPRGDADSSPVTRYVGQCGRHRPQDDARGQLVVVDEQLHAATPARVQSTGRVERRLRPAGSDSSGAGVGVGPRRDRWRVGARRRRRSRPRSCPRGWRQGAGGQRFPPADRQVGRARHLAEGAYPAPAASASMSAGMALEQHPGRVPSHRIDDGRTAAVGATRRGRRLARVPLPGRVGTGLGPQHDLGERSRGCRGSRPAAGTGRSRSRSSRPARRP